jgi:hypothetical protein
MFAHLGGEDRVSEPERMLCRRTAAFETELVFLEHKFARTRSEGGEPTPSDLDLYSRMASAQRRMLETVGMARTPHDITPSLQQYIASKTRPGGTEGKSAEARETGPRDILEFVIDD